MTNIPQNSSPPPPPPPPSLRERRRLETELVIHEAAKALVLEDGLHGATIDAISVRSGISQRTFFNYFASKEDAVLGTRSPTLSDDALARFRDESQGDLFSRAVRLMFSVMRSTSVGNPFASRKELVARFPELRRRLAALVTECEHIVGDTLVDPATSEEVTEALGVEGGRDSARAFLTLASAVLRFSSLNSEATDPDEREAEVEKAIHTFREVVRKTI